MPRNLRKRSRCCNYYRSDRYTVQLGCGNSERHRCFRKDTWGALTKLVYVELDDSGQILGVITHKKSIQLPDANVKQLPKAEAVREIRKKVFERSKGLCEWCGQNIIWNSFEMHETTFKSDGGMVSLENSVALCHQCHQGREDSAHGDRRWQTGIRDGRN